MSGVIHKHIVPLAMSSAVHMEFMLFYQFV